jgi:hypothetical protein
VAARSWRSGGGSARRRRAMGSGSLRLSAWTEVGQGRFGPASAGRFIARVEDDAATGGSQVGDVARQAGPASASVSLTGGT